MITLREDASDLTAEHSDDMRAEWMDRNDWVEDDVPGWSEL